MKTAAQKIILWGLVIILFASCKKPAPDTTDGFIKYTIKANQQYCEPNVFTETNYTELKFIVKFDSTAIYQTLSSSNQDDINKLCGFADNGADHQQFSARIGWRWSNGALRLFGYTYNNAVRSFEELATINIGEEHNCGIKVTPSSYIFTVNNTSKTMPRASIAATAIGYKLYPYFGGDETAPHDIYIWIKDL